MDLLALLHSGLYLKDKAISNCSAARLMQAPMEFRLPQLHLSLMFIFTVDRCLTVID